MHSFSCHRRPPGLASELSWWKPLPTALKGKMLETPLFQLFKDRANYKSKNKPLYSTVSDAFHLTRISPEIRPFPSHLKLSFKDLLCTISTFQRKIAWNASKGLLKTREVFNSRCPFSVPQGPGGLALSSLDRKKHRHPPERNACLVDGQHCLVIHGQCATGHPLDEKP